MYLTVTGLSRLSSSPMKPKSVWANGKFKTAVPWLILGACAVFWFIFFALASPLPGGPDVFVFRDAGCNWAERERSGSRIGTSCKHRSSTTVCQLYAGDSSALRRGCFALRLFRIGRHFLQPRMGNDCSLPALPLLQPGSRGGKATSLGSGPAWGSAPYGIVAFDSDRPEMPAFCLLVAILLLWRHASSAMTGLSC